VYTGRAGRVEEHPWGIAMLTDDLPRVWDANFVLADRWEGSAAELAAEADRVLGAAGLRHRKVAIHDQALGARLWPELPAGSWPFHDRYLVLAHRRKPDRLGDPALEVAELDLDSYVRVHEPVVRAEPYGSDEETVRQLLELPRRTAAAIEARLFAGLVDGEPVAYASLLLDGAVAQIEDVATHAEHRGKGLARAVVLRCLAETRRAGAELVWLVADDKDWPKELYARLGFDPLGVETMFGRPAE